jgi:hypothetical protein
MCYACADNGAWGSFAGSNAYGYATSLMPADGVGDLKPPIPPFTGILNTVDVASDSIGGNNPTLTIDGPTITATIDRLEDQDFYKIELTAGQTIEIGMYAKVGGLPLNGQLGVPLADSFFEIYDSAGKLLALTDGGGPNTPQGLDAQSKFTALSTGTYYINARSFDQDATNGEKGDGVGDYDLFVRSAVPDEPRPPVNPRYDTDSPLHSIDWGGVRVTGTSNNPDGNSGPLPNKFAQSPGGVSGGGADGGDHSNVGTVKPIAGKNVITYYFAKAGDTFTAEDPTQSGLETTIQARTMEEFEKIAYRNTFKEYERVADVVYVEVATREEAYFKIVTNMLTPGPGASILGRASAPGETNEGQMEFNAFDERYTEGALAQGGFFFQTLLHEFGHAHGLAHPHDNGGGSSVMRGGGGGTGGLGGGFGDFNLSQQVFTIMSYNDGWALSPYGQPDDSSSYGWAGTLGALDIAVIQDKYGVNEDTGKGNNTYVLKDVNERGTYYQTIWDASGTDTIRYDGVRQTVIDLRAATLKYEEGGGGRMSYADGIFGGYTIANGVTIENATGGNGVDTITGNAVANVLDGRSGNDTIDGGAGADSLLGRDGNDVLVGGSGADRLSGGAGRDTLTGGADADVFVFDRTSDINPTAPDRITDWQSGDKIDLRLIDANLTVAGDQAFTLISGKFTTPGQIQITQKNGDTYINLNNDADSGIEATIVLSGLHTLTASDFVL